MNEQALLHAQGLTGLNFAQYAASKNLADEQRKLGVQCIYDGVPIQTDELTGMGARGAGAGIVTNAALLLSGCGLGSPSLQFAVDPAGKVTVTCDNTDKAWIVVAFAASYVTRKWLQNAVDRAKEAGVYQVDAETGHARVEMKTEQQRINLAVMQQLARNRVWSVEKGKATDLSPETTQQIAEYMARM